MTKTTYPNVIMQGDSAAGSLTLTNKGLVYYPGSDDVKKVKIKWSHVTSCKINAFKEGNDNHLLRILHHNGENYKFALATREDLVQAKLDIGKRTTEAKGELGGTAGGTEPSERSESFRDLPTTTSPPEDGEGNGELVPISPSKRKEGIPEARAEDDGAAKNDEPSQSFNTAPAPISLEGKAGENELRASLSYMRSMEETAIAEIRELRNELRESNRRASAIEETLVALQSQLCGSQNLNHSISAPAAPMEHSADPNPTTLNSQPKQKDEGTTSTYPIAVSNSVTEPKVEPVAVQPVSNVGLAFMNGSGAGTPNNGKPRKRRCSSDLEHGAVIPAAEGLEWEDPFFDDEPDLVATFDIDFDGRIRFYMTIYMLYNVPTALFIFIILMIRASNGKPGIPLGLSIVNAAFFVLLSYGQWRLTVSEVRSHHVAVTRDGVFAVIDDHLEGGFCGPFMAALHGFDSCLLVSKISETVCTLHGRG